VLAATLAALAGPAAAAPDATRVGLSDAYARLPLAFEANRGQADPQVKFLARGRGYTLFLTSTEAVLALGKSGSAVLRMKVLGASEASRVTGTSELPGRTSYFRGNDPASWHIGVPSHAEVRYEAIYPGVDLLFHGRNQGQLEYDFVVGPGIDPAVIRLAFEGATGMTLDGAGDLVLHAPGGDVVERAPVAYQEIDGSRRPVDARYEITARNQVAFRVGAYDRARPLVIDPVLAYSTYLGGSSVDQADAVAVDASGSAYVTGGTCSLDFPLRNPAQGTLRACDAFVTKLSPAGDAIVYSTYLGGAVASEEGVAIAVDPSGSAYVTGRTCSSSFPTVNPFQASLVGGGCDAFVSKLSPAGNALVYSTYLGGTCGETGTGIAADASGHAYVVGETGAIYPFNQPCAAANFPTANAFQGAHGGLKDAFVAKLAPAGNALVYSTYLGGTQDDGASGIALDAAGNVYVSGATLSASFPTVNAFQACGSGGEDAFVAKLSPTGGALVYSTCLGGGCADLAHDIALDGAGHAYVTGQTCSFNFPTVNPLQAAYAGLTDAFVAKLSPAGNSLVYSTFLGGNSTDTGFGIAVDGAGNAHVAGWTFSATFPTVNPVQATKGSGLDGFVARLTPAGNALVYSTFLGGTDATFNDHSDMALGIAVDGSGAAYVVGMANATNFPTANALQPAKAGGSDAFVTKLVADAPPVNPVAQAGADQTAGEGAPVTLDGSASADPNGDPLTYLWEQIGGPPVTLSDATAAQPSFTAPDVPSGGATLTFRLTVSDGVHASEPDTVDITVTNVNHPPVTDAGADQTVREDTPVTLRGGGTFDDDGDPLTYQWTQTAGPAVSLADPTAAEPTFTAPPVGPAGGTLVFALTVSDGAAQSTDQVQIVVTNANQAPAAEAGPNQTVDELRVVTLDGTASSDPDGDALTHAWTQVSGPPVGLSSPASAVTGFTAPAVGPGGAVLVFQLVVRDGAASSAPDRVTVTVRDVNQAPACGLAQPTASVLWPPNHKLVRIRIAGVADPEDHDVQVTITGVKQDEPVNGSGDGDTSPDAVLQGESVLVRAERSGNGTGRVYKVTFKAQDGSGAACTGNVLVCVPHNHGAACVNEGTIYDSTSPHGPCGHPGH
jgi:hypothetical protein